ncbi:MAG: Calx-beta domain-containing protein [Ramlibacter sp.]|uniref:Calx-beta domain-containing protein n=1 Tax=Ramlibacter sp. TaxID=1917967 RepID=UPI00261DBD74|nr:Calx-beta domain-containing protein [Ramlibacter sp.]MDH4377451.1 Calx-beta domain-containing protein [Ramlibacter sp.]
MSKAKNTPAVAPHFALGLRRPSIRSMALEQRFMFDGAAVADASANLLDAYHGDGRTDASPAASSALFTVKDTAAPAALAQAQQAASRLITDFLHQPGAREQVYRVLSGGNTAQEPSPQWLAAWDRLLAEVESGQAPLRIEVIGAQQMHKALGAFAERGIDGERVVFINADWLAAGANEKAIEWVLVEEFGHAMDARLNAGIDTPGDEGHAFAAMLANGQAGGPADGGDDRARFVIAGQAIDVETAAPYAIAQIHYVPMAEADVQTSLKAISTAVTGNIQTVIAITATSNGTVVVYDHWEDGFEADIKNPLQASTKVWTYNNGWFVDTDGDGSRNGAEPAVSGTGITVSGRSIILTNAVNPASPSTIDFDGRDKIGSTKAISVTRAGWSLTPGTVLAGAVNVIDSGNAGKTYTLPVGQNVQTVATGTDKLFEYTSAHIIATQNNTTVTVDKDGNGTVDLTITLNEGQSYLVSGGLNAGAKITADKGVGVYLIAGDVGSTYENRWFALTPDEQWASSYYAPVGTTLAANPAYVLIYNPNGANIRYETATGTGTITPSGSSGTTWASNSSTKTSYFLMPASAARFYTTDKDASGNLKSFFAVSVIDADATANQTHDWSYSLVPETYLSDKFVVGWGPGADNVTRAFASTDLNASPVWVTPTADTVLYVDSATVTMKDSAGNTIAKTQDGSTGTYKYTVKRLESYRLFDADKDQTGLTVYTKDGTLITAAWGEDPSIAGAGAPYLDMGTTITPFPDYVLGKSSAETSTSVEAGASDNDTIIELGEQVTYTVTLTNRAVIDLYDIVLKDTVTPADSAEYVANSTLVTVYSPEGKRAWTIAGTTQTFYAADGVTVTSTVTNSGLAGTAFPLAGAGYRLADLDPSTPNVADGLKRGGMVEVSYRVKVRSTINKALSDSDSTITNSVTMVGTGVQKDKVNETQVAVTVTDGEVFFMDSGFTKSMASYIGGTDNIGLRVADGDQNKNSAVAETLTVKVTNTTTGEIEQVVLTETGVNTGIFQNTLVSSASGSDSANNSGKLVLTTSNNIKAEYTDPTSGQDGGATGIDNPVNWGITAATYTSGSNSNLKLANGVSLPPPAATDGEVGFFNAAYTNAFINFTEGDTLYIQVTDDDQNTSGLTVQTLSVTVTNNSTGEVETVSLTETGANTGIFRGSLITSTAAAAAASQNGTLSMSLGDSVLVDYTDPVTGSTFDNPSKPGITSPYTTGDANRDSFTVVKSKTLYLSGTGDLDRIDPLASADGSLSQTAAVTPGSSISRTISDSFTAQSYSGGTGWATGSNWTEANDDSDATNGDIEVASSAANGSGNGLVFAGSGSNNLTRLSRSFAALTATGTLSFDYKLNGLDANDAGLTVEYTSNGSTWTQLGTIKRQGSTSGSDTFTAYPNNSNLGVVGVTDANLPVGATGIRFSFGASRSSDQIFIDNIVISSGSVSVVAPATFTQAIPMATAIGLPAGGMVGVTTHISAASGLTSGSSYADITAALVYTPSGGGADVTVASLGSASYTQSSAGVGTLSWGGEVGASGVTIPKGATTKLVITNNLASSSFKIDYDSSGKPSKIDLPVSNVIGIVDVDGVDTNSDGDTDDAGEGGGTVTGVQEIGFFDKSFSAGGGNQITAGTIDAGGTVFIRVKVKDPFGAYDISDLKLSIDGPDTLGDIGVVAPVSATVVGSPANGDTYKIFEYAWTTANNTGEYAVTVTALEGLEGTISDAAAGTFTVTAKDLGTPAITEFISGLRGSVSGATYAQGANAFVRVTDLDEASATASKTITATVNGTAFTLTQTGANTGIFEAALSGAGFTNLAQGTVLSASYVDPDDSTDSGGDSISVPVPANTAPTATANARTISENQTASGANLITSNEGSGDDTDADATDLPNLRVAAINGSGIAQTSATTTTTVRLASGAQLTVAPDGSYTYDPSGAFDYLNAGESSTDTFTYTLSDGRGGTSTATVTLTINGVSPPPALSIDDVTVDEAAGVMNFTVTKSGWANQTVTVSYNTVASSATAGADYTASSDSLTLGVNEISKTISVPIINDGIYEGSETFSLILTSPVNATINRATGIGTILDDGQLGGDDDQPTLAVTGMNVEEGSRATFTVNLSNALAAATTINLALNNVSTAGADYNSASYQWSQDSGATWATVAGNQVTLSAGKTSFLVRVATTNDATYEGPESFNLTASFASAPLLYADRSSGAQRVGASANADTTIYDDGSIDGDDGSDADTTTVKDDDRPSFAVSDVTVNEAAGTLTFTVTKTGSTTQNATVAYTFSDGSAKAGAANDFTGAAGTLTFLPSDSSKSVQVTINNDSVFEGSESFTINLSNVAAATISDAQGSGTIKDDGTGGDDDGDNSDNASDSAKNDDRTISITAAAPVNEGSTYAMFTVTAANGYELDLAIQAASSGTAAAFAGFTSIQWSTDGTSWTAYTSGKPTVPASGKVYVRVDISSESDLNFEGTETFAVKAAYTSNIANSAAGETSIVDDGSGTKYGPDMPGGTPAESTTGLDDDLGVSVTAYGPVNEASTYAMFTVNAIAGYALDLSLQGTAAAGDAEANFAGFMPIEFSTDGTHWTVYSSTSKPTVPVGGRVYVRVTITSEADALLEGAEGFGLKAAYTIYSAKSAAGETSIVDDGSGKKYGPDMPSGTPAESTTGLDDDTSIPLPPSPPTPTPPPPPAPPELPATPAAPVAPEPVRPPTQGFNSTLQPLEAKRVEPAAPPAPPAIGELLTSSRGFPVVVDATRPAGLQVFKGVTDQFVEGTSTAKVSMPYDAFVHSKADAVIQLTASLADGTPLPPWVQFDQRSGSFEVDPAASGGFKGKIDLKVTARDGEDREATVLFRMFVGEQPPAEKPADKPQSRNSLSEKLRLAAKRSTLGLPLDLLTPIDLTPPDQATPDLMQTVKVSLAESATAH